MRKTVFIIFFIFSLVVCEKVSATFLRSNSEIFIDDVQKLNKQSERDEKLLNEILADFKSLEGNDYEDTNPLFLFYMGKVYRELGKIKNDTELLKIATLYFSKLELFTKNTKQLSEYRTAIVMDAYTLSDLATLLKDGNFVDAKNKIDNFIKEYPDLIDGSVNLCKANIYNASGFHYYSVGNFRSAVNDFEIACKFKEEGWPVFANNFINACLEAYDNTKSLKRKQEYLKKALKVFEIHKSKSYWIHIPKYTKTGKVLEFYLRKNGIEFGTEKEISNKQQNGESAKEN